MMVIRLLLMVTLITILNACMGWSYYHEPVTKVERPHVTGLSKAEQQAIAYCLGENVVVPGHVELDCSVSGMEILRKVKNIVIKFKAYVIEQETIIEKHNESNEAN